MADQRGTDVARVCEGWEEGSKEDIHYMGSRLCLQRRETRPQILPVRRLRGAAKVPACGFTMAGTQVPQAQREVALPEMSRAQAGVSRASE